MEGQEKSVSFLNRNGDLLCIPKATITVVQSPSLENSHNLRKKQAEAHLPSATQYTTAVTQNLSIKGGMLIIYIIGDGKGHL